MKNPGNKSLAARTKTVTGACRSPRQPLRKNDEEAIFGYNFRFFGVTHRTGETGYGETQSSGEIQGLGQKKNGCASQSDKQGEGEKNGA
jgi:hypothetical protein